MLINLLILDYCYTYNHDKINKYHYDKITLRERETLFLLIYFPL